MLIDSLWQSAWQKGLPPSSTTFFAFVLSILLASVPLGLLVTLFVSLRNLASPTTKNEKLSSLLAFFCYAPVGSMWYGFLLVPYVGEVILVGFILVLVLSYLRMRDARRCARE